MRNKELFNAMVARHIEKKRLFNLKVLTWYRDVIRKAIKIKMKRKIRFQKGNKKLAEDEKIAFIIFSLPAVLTCPGATELCMKNCYARRDERFIGTRASRIINFLISKQDDFETVLYDALIKEIYTKKGELRRRFVGKEIVVRIHESGDFYSDRYMNAWFNVARQLQNVTFFAYTKSFAMYERNHESKPDNFTMRASVWADTTVEEIAIIARLNMPIYTAYDETGVNEAIASGATHCTCESCTKCGCACARANNKEIVTEIH